jgi:hypothetical protein
MSAMLPVRRMSLLRLRLDGLRLRLEALRGLGCPVARVLCERRGRCRERSCGAGGKE